MRKHFILLLLNLSVCLPTMAQTESALQSLSTLEKMVLIIKRYEGWHDNPRDPNYIGWGHRIQPHERHLNQNITRAQGDSLLYEDLKRFIHHFKRYGKDAALLSCLAYNVGLRPIEGDKTHPPSRLIRKIRVGRSDFKEDYLDFDKWKGKVVPSIRQRRKAELLLLYEE